ncbi:MAG: hypothetical protein ACREH4_11755 [Vitreimonas sp.]
MSGRKVLYTTFLASGVFAAAVFAVSALAQDMVNAPAEPEGPPPIDFTDPHAPFTGAALDLTVRDGPSPRFSALDRRQSTGGEGPRRVELALTAGGGDAPLDISIAHRASLGADGNGDLDRQGRGSELRLGQGLVGEREGPRDSTYIFIASENEALTWQPGTRTEFGGRGGSFALQDRVEVGDLSAGVTWERNGVQTSLAYVERKRSTRVGRQSYSHDESFAGVTVTMRH